MIEKIHLTAEKETLFIPLIGKAQMSRKGQILRDKKAEEIVDRVDYDFSKSGSNRFIAIYMAIRAAILDGYVDQFIARHADARIIHLGCGLDSRIDRLAARPRIFYDLDFPEVIEVRHQFFSEDSGYRMIASSATDLTWLDQIDAQTSPTLVIAEGMTMYLSEQEISELVLALSRRFPGAEMVFDAYSVSAVRLSQRKNPVNAMGARIRWGLDDPRLFEQIASSIRHLSTAYFPDYPGVNDLTGMTRVLFKLLYGNRWANHLYRIYRFQL